MSVAQLELIKALCVVVLTQGTVAPVPLVRFPLLTEQNKMARMVVIIVVTGHIRLDQASPAVNHVLLGHSTQ